MRPTTVHHRVPRAGVDAIDSHELALLTVTMAVTWPPRHETVVVLLDDTRRGIAIVVVTGTSCPDDVFEVLECLTRPDAHGGRAGAVIVASVRPGGALDERDVDRWLELSDVAEQHGVELVEWFVIGADPDGAAGDSVCPRDLLGEPPRW